MKKSHNKVKYLKEDKRSHNIDIFYIRSDNDNLSKIYKNWFLFLCSARFKGWIDKGNIKLFFRRLSF